MAKEFKTKVDITVAAEGAEYEMQTKAQKVADNAAGNLQALADLTDAVSEFINDMPKIIDAQRTVESGLHGALDAATRRVLEQTTKIKTSVVNNIPRTPIMKMKNAIAPTKLKEAEEIAAANGEIIKIITAEIKNPRAELLKNQFTDTVRNLEAKLHAAVGKAQEQLQKAGFKK